MDSWLDCGAACRQDVSVPLRHPSKIRCGNTGTTFCIDKYSTITFLQISGQKKGEVNRKIIIRSGKIEYYDLVKFNKYIFEAEHGMGVPERAAESLKGYVKWREGYGWGEGTVVKIILTDKVTEVISRVTRMDLPTVYVNWACNDVPRRIVRVVPLTMREISILPETVQGHNKINPPICKAGWKDFLY